MQALGNNGDCMKKLYEISTDFPYESKFEVVNGHKMHYIDHGSHKKDPMIFLHGLPAHSYIWRNIIPYLSKNARCIALDLIGMGKSDKPDIDYSFTEHTDYLDKFIAQLGLKNVTLVMHGFGGTVGLLYAMKNDVNVKALSLYEVYTHAFSDKKTSLPAKQLLDFMAENPKESYKAVVNNNFLLKKILAHGLVRQITPVEFANYEAPLKDKKDREILWKNLTQLHDSANDLITKQCKYLQINNKPKLMLYSLPGFVTSMEAVEWCQCNIPNLSVVEIGEGYNFGQETDPKGFATVLKKWYQDIDD